MSRRISFRTTSDAQHEEIAIYAQVKGFKDASSFALYAVVTMMSENALTASQQKRADELREERK